ncbi:MAG: LTA synthase family protein [Clostridia bacterium]|nr:LTA synthase family protein [Clostridia bacterium]
MAKRGSGAEKRRKIEYESGDGRARLLLLPLLALGLALLVELGNRGLSVGRLTRFVVGRPLYFLYGALLILASLTFSELFRRRRAVLATTCIVWLVLGVVEYIVVKDRIQPFCSVDILMLKDAFSLITLYYTLPQIILMFLGGFGAIALVIFLFARMKRRRRVNRGLSLTVFLGMVLLCAMVAALGIRVGFFPRRFDSLVDAYNDYGFATCFVFTFGKQGISKPQTYSEDTVSDILEEIEGATGEEELVYPVFDEADNLAQPNIVFLQLESFFDVNTILGGEYSADPTPWFNRLCSRFSSGLLYVPTVGGGTANTEFEVISGLALDFFGAGEFPYNTILQNTTCESLCYDLKDYGYTATALHNNRATFYSRNLVYPNLGFDRFVSLEYMKDVKYTPLGWARDAGLTEEILTALDTTESRDLIYCVAVETHGKYAETYEPKPGDIEVLSLPEAIPLAPFENFINALPGTDGFLRDMTLALLRFDEPTVVVAFGDHLPALEIENDMLSTGSVYASRYVIWNNFGGHFEAPDLEAYRLNANLLKQLGFTGGVVTKLHQSVDPQEAGPEYLEKLELLEYDMLYGDRQAFEGDFPYQPADMRLGSRDIRIAGASREYHRLLVTGENFTEFSRILAGEQPLDTLYIDSEHIVARVEDGQEITEIRVAQVDRDGVELSRTEAYAMR